MTKITQSTYSWYLSLGNYKWCQDHGPSYVVNKNSEFRQNKKVPVLLKLCNRWLLRLFYCYYSSLCPFVPIVRTKGETSNVPQNISKMTIKHTNDKTSNSLSKFVKSELWNLISWHWSWSIIPLSVVTLNFIFKNLLIHD